jgi:hypothetical protein
MIEGYVVLLPPLHPQKDSEFNAIVEMDKRNPLSL